MGEQPSLQHQVVPVYGAGLEEEKMSETGKSAPWKDAHCKDSVPWASLRESQWPIKAHRGAGLRHSKCFLRSQEQQGNQGCRILSFLWLGNGIYLICTATGSGPMLSSCEGNVLKFSPHFLLVSGTRKHHISINSAGSPGTPGLSGES